MISKFAVENRVVVGFCVSLIILGGIWSYLSMGRLEDPEFSIKTAVVVTIYSGASAEHVEQRVTSVIERHIRKVKGVEDIRSVSRPGMSIVYVDMLDNFPPEQLPKAWQELRNKMGEVKRELPPEAMSPIVQDDFGDVFGVMLALTGDGYSDAELRERAKELQNQLFCVDQVGRVELWGERKECIEVEMSRARMSELSIHPAMIMYALAGHNLQFDAGEMTLGRQRVRIEPSGGFSSVEEIGNLIIPNSQSGHLLQHTTGMLSNTVSPQVSSRAMQLLGGNSGDYQPIRLQDIATIRRTYVDPPSKIMRSNGKSAIVLAIAPIEGGDVIRMGNLVRQKVDEVLKTFPTGFSIDTVCYQPDNVVVSINTFENNLREAILIVTIVVLIAMGWRSGLIITSSLLIVMLGTLCILFPMGVVLQRTSLGSFIVALGILVDDAVVVGDMILVKMQRGIPRKQACIDGANHVGKPLLGATIVGALAFWPVYLSPDMTGEYSRDLFLVIGISLMISWFVAMMQTPVAYFQFMPDPKPEPSGVHNGPVYRAYRASLNWALHHKTVVLGMMVLAVVVSGVMFGHVRKIFFPPALRTQFLVEYRLPEGASIHAVADDLQKIEQHLAAYNEVTQVSTFIGSGPPRFYLPYEPERFSSSYGCILVNVKEMADTPKLVPIVTDWLTKNFPDSTEVMQFSLGPSTRNDVEIRFAGPDHQMLRQLSEQAKQQFREVPIAGRPRDDWRERVPVWVPEYSQAKGLQTMTSRTEMSTALRWATDGISAAVYSEDDNLLPIYLRGTQQERNEIEHATNIPVWGLASQSVPLGQVIAGNKVEWRDVEIQRRNGTPTITVGCNAKFGSTWNELLGSVRKPIEAIELPDGYTMTWGGQYEKSQKSQSTLLAQLPIALIFMGIIVVVLFNDLRQPIIIMLTFPLALIGVTFGLLITGMPFGFMALVGTMSLLGMIVRNGVVLMGQIDTELAKGDRPYDAIVDASVERMRPVTVAAMTVIVGMAPLLRDPLFNSMAAAVMFGLIFATVLTLFVVPCLYMIFFRVPFSTPNQR